MHTHTASWLPCHLPSASSRPHNFAVRLAPAELAPGAHFARVRAMDATDRARGPLFSLPVTVIVPHADAATEGTLNFNLSLAGGKPARRFLATPASAEWATVKLVTGALPRGPHAITFHAVPSARGDLPHVLCETKKVIVLREHSEEVIQVPKWSALRRACQISSQVSSPAPSPSST